MADTGSTPIADSPPGSRKAAFLWDPSKLEALAAAIDRPKNVGKKQSTSEHVMAVRDTESNLIYSARHVYAPIGEHNGSKTFHSQAEKENLEKKKKELFFPDGPAGSRGDSKLLSSVPHGRFEAPTGNFEASWFSLLADHRPAGVPVQDDSQTCKVQASEVTERAQPQMENEVEEESPRIAVAPHAPPHVRAGGKQPYPYPPIVEHHIGGKAVLPATEKANGGPGRSVGRSTASEAARSSTPQPSAFEAQEEQQSAPQQSGEPCTRQRIPVPVEVAGTTSRVPVYRSRATRQAQAAPSRPLGPHHALTAHPRSVSPLRGGPALVAARDHHSRSPSPLRGVTRMGSSPARFPTPLQRGLHSVSPPASPLQSRSFRSPNCNSLPLPQSQAYIRGSASNGIAYPQSVSVPGCSPASSPVLPSVQSGSFGSTQSLPPWSLAGSVGRRSSPSANGPGDPGPAFDPNFLRRSLGIGGSHLPVPLPIGLRTPPSSCNSLCTASPGSSVAAPSASSLAVPMPGLRAGSYRPDLAQDHALIGRGLSWAPVRGEARGNLGENYYGSPTPERQRSRDPRGALHDSKVSAYPSSPSRGKASYSDLGASLPPHGRERPVPPPPPLAPEPGWAPVVDGSARQTRAPRVGESIVCSSPHLPDGELAATHSNLQDDANRGSYADSFAEANTWLRPPFGKQHQVVGHA